MKKVVIICTVSLLIVGFGFLLIYNFITYGGDGELAEGSYRTKNFFLLDVKNDTLPKKEYKLKTDFDYPKDSIYKQTDDFELSTENLPRPKYTRDYDPKKRFEPIFLNEYVATGKLEEAWKLDLGFCDKSNACSDFLYYRGKGSLDDYVYLEFLNIRKQPEKNNYRYYISLKNKDHTEITDLEIVTQRGTMMTIS
ncbi:MAG: hypothetical protein R2883_03270 [Caldisericia bacterium]